MKHLRAFWAWLNHDPEYAAAAKDSDVNVRDNPAGFVECVDCPLDGYYATWDDADMADHLRQHKAAGHQVPPLTISELLHP